MALTDSVRRSAERLFVGVARWTKRSYIRYSLHSLTVALGDYIHYFYYYEILVFVLLLSQQ